MEEKIKINAIPDDASNKTFQNEAVAEILGLQEPLGKVQFYVLSDTVETFKSMPIKIEIESVDGRFFKGNKRKNVSVESHWRLQSCELERRTIRINGCI